MHEFAWYRRATALFNVSFHPVLCLCCIMQTCTRDQALQIIKGQEVLSKPDASKMLAFLTRYHLDRVIAHYRWRNAFLLWKLQLICIDVVLSAVTL